MQFMGLYKKSGILLWVGKPIDTTHGVNVAWAAHLALNALNARKDQVNREAFYVAGDPLNLLDVAVHMTSRFCLFFLRFCHVSRRCLPLLLLRNRADICRTDWETNTGSYPLFSCTSSLLACGRQTLYGDYVGVSADCLCRE